MCSVSKCLLSGLSSLMTGSGEVGSRDVGKEAGEEGVGSRWHQ